jgi:hypothetical protein
MLNEVVKSALEVELDTVKELRKQIKEWTKENDTGHYGLDKGTVATLLIDLDNALSRVASLASSIEWYANVKNYTHYTSLTEIDLDNGKRARRAIGQE